jgi:ribosomal protein L11 methyltransferase
VKGTGADEVLYVLDAPDLSAQVVSSEEALIWCPAGSENEILPKIRELGLTVTPEAIQAVKSAEPWQRFTVCGIEIVPVEDPDAPLPSKAPDSLYLVPGAAFGTGKSITTSLLLEVLKQVIPRIKKGGAILDLGCGTGLVSMCLARWTDASIVAIDNDPLAIDNARMNLKLNDADRRITVSEMDAVTLTDRFDLIAANVETFIHRALMPIYARCLAEGGMLVLGGVKTDEVSEFEQMFFSPPSSWRQLDVSRQGEWSVYQVGRSGA